MKTQTIKDALTRIASVLVLVISVAAWAQPQPGDIFREFTFNCGKTKTTHFSELDPDCSRKKDPNFAMRTMKPAVPKAIVLDLEHAIRAELSVEYWGGHIGTSKQQFSVNSNAWVDLPQPEGTPGNPVCYQRTLLGNNVTSIPLNHLRHGTNHIQFLAGPQVCYNFNWGFYWIYDFTVRVYYSPSKPHPKGRITAPAAGETVGDRPLLKAEASSANSTITHVAFVGEYEDFDWSGRGSFQQWHYYTDHGVIRSHIGTATSAPWQAEWQTEWVPDQSLPLRLAARVTDAVGITCVTPAVEGVRLARSARSVKMVRASNVPEKFAARAKGRAGCDLILPPDLTRPQRAQLLMSTWSASTDDDSVHELLLNGQRLGNRFGAFHNYSFDTLEVPVELLKPGTNRVEIYSTFSGHALEINWPGPVLLMEFNK